MTGWPEIADIEKALDEGLTVELSKGKGGELKVLTVQKKRLKPKK